MQSTWWGIKVMAIYIDKSDNSIIELNILKD
jgi:hypothetical protein